MKKIVAGLLSFLMVFAVGFGLAGCGKTGKLDGKTFEQTDIILTLVKSYEEDGITVKETESLNSRQFIERCWRIENEVEIDATLTAEQTEAIETIYTEVYESSVKSVANANKRKDGLEKLIIFEDGAFTQKTYKIEYGGFKVSDGILEGTYTLVDNALTLNGHEETIYTGKTETVVYGSYDGTTIVINTTGEAVDIDLEDWFSAETLGTLDFFLAKLVFTLVA